MVHPALPSLLALTIGACAATPDVAGPAADVAKGQAVAQGACAGCHGMDPGKSSPRPGAPAFGSLEMRHTVGLPGRLAELTRGGHYGMPPVTLAPEDLRNLLTFMENLDRPRQVPRAR